ncbi:hypothetical protein QR680_018016 [Steinernema hermaphroditum]|uniref:G-protein coupled receptors family 1 profile domain-containing protein n=1 Tax=Steinernema hermaphroditum TaxID=289476 RepID=A0AA39HIQ6_9BILA|nr:hypothetical protein QR680_018016 [Steinernema hermaphroditum]
MNRVTYFTAGLIFIFSSSTLFVVNAVLLKILLKYKEYSTCTYRIIKNMCVSAMIQLSIFFIGGFMTLSESTFHPFFEKFCGAILSSTFLLYLALSVALALDRLMIFLSLIPKLRNGISAIFLAAAWTFCLAFFITELTPNYNFIYFSQYQFLGWYYAENHESLELGTFEFYYDLATLFVSLIIYFLIVLILFKSRKTTTSMSSWRAELRVLIIAVATFLYELILVVSGFFGIEYLPKTSFSPVLFSVLWIVDCGFFAVVTVLVNSSIRGKVKRLLFPKRMMVTVTSSSLRRY